MILLYKCPVNDFTIENSLKIIYQKMYYNWFYNKKCIGIHFIEKNDRK